MLKFAIFDHLDSDGGPLGRFFEDRLRLLELIEQSGFQAYHLAEHHSTPLGMAASPSVFLAAAIQRTRLRLRRQLQVTARVMAQARLRLRGATTIPDRLVSIFDPEARPFGAES